MTDTPPHNPSAGTTASRRRSTGRRRALVVAAAVIVVALGVGLLIAAADPGPASFVGRDTCATCHQQQHESWHGSDHDRAMQVVDESTVLGDFNNASFEHMGLVTRFHRDGDAFVVNTEGPDGKLHDYKIAYTFGVRPLQQYLVEFPGGRFQALTVAWDTQSKKWFTLYPDQRHSPDDWLHWTQRGQNCNSNCAVCHSTDLRKGYDFATDTYHTTYSEINVSCEACHGPGSRHVHWAEAGRLGRMVAGYDEATKGLTHTMKDPGRAWGFDEKGNPKLVHTTASGPDQQVDVCARCHALRSPVTIDDRIGDRFLDHWQPGVLQPAVYHPDGQILGEVYEYGSFGQSKMHHAGVRCTDCHDPHTTKTVAPGNALCVRCHIPARYDTPEHHRHPIAAAASPENWAAPGPPGTNCVDCHMPIRHYMVVDPRRDHSLRIPRPDLSPITGAPNACNQCHTDKGAAWASAAVVRWYGDNRVTEAKWGPTFAAAWNGDPRAGEGLGKLFSDAQQPVVIRASAAVMLQSYLDNAGLNAAVAQLADRDPWVRREAAVLLVAAPPQQRAQFLTPLLYDPVRTVRFAAARSLAAVGTPAQAPDRRIARQHLSSEAAASLDRILAEHEAALKAHADNRGGRLALGAFYQDVDRPTDALAAYRKAVEFDRRDIDAAMALAVAAEGAGHRDEARLVLERLLDLPKPPETPPDMWSRATGQVHFSLGLMLAADPATREQGIAHLIEASSRLVDDPGVQYNLGLSLSAAGRLDLAEQAMLKARRIDPGNPQYLFALATMSRDHGDMRRAMHFAQQFVIEFPRHPQAAGLMREMQRGAQQQP